MIAYALLLAASIVCWSVCFWVSDFELLSPAPIAFIGFILSSALALIGLSSWNTIELSANAMAIILVGMAGITSAAILGARFQLPRRLLDGSNSSSFFESAVPTWRLLLLLMIVAFAIMIRVYESIKLGKQLGFDTTSFSDLSRTVRRITSTLYTTDSVAGGARFSLLERQLEKVVNMAGFAAAFLLGRSLMQPNRKETVFSFLILLLCTLFLLTAGSRGMLFYWIIAFFVCISLMQFRGKTRDEKLSISGRIVIFGCLAGFACALFMYSVSALVGRKAGSPIVEYVSFYFGGSAPSLQLLLDAIKKGVPVLSGPQSVFYSIYLLLLKIHLIQDLPAYSLTWIDCGGHTSNIFTCFGRYYVGFGYVGVLLFSFASTFLMIKIYEYARYKMTPASITVAGLICAFAFDSAREEFVFSRLIGSTYVLNIIILVAITIFLTKKDIPLLGKWEDAIIGKIRGNRRNEGASVQAD